MKAKTCKRYKDHRVTLTAVFARWAPLSTMSRHVTLESCSSLPFVHVQFADEVTWVEMLPPQLVGADPLFRKPRANFTAGLWDILQSDGEARTAQQSQLHHSGFKFCSAQVHG